MPVYITKRATSRKLTTSIHEYFTSPLDDSSDILLSVVNCSVVSILDPLEQDLRFKHRINETRMRKMATFLSKLYMRRRANARTVVNVLHIVWIIRKTEVNATESEFCGNDEDTMVRKTVNAKNTVIE
ncbi:hypothetical protein DPMN_041531 [Dreissena polymorpha]|uniref:Uncharacterized protein n=1 Tax=Dreissena polymorpha TaxID=45954 RepID=A0A9D4HU01_DREPO|nr:hypothetical protein DPMN_041531 [Dreissena polymorpha]